MLWLHCNKCGIPKDTNKKNEFYCGSCIHIFCKECSRVKICPFDKRPFNGIKICGTMPQKLRVYFENPDKLLKPWQKCIQFQCEQRSLTEQRRFSDNTKQLRQVKKEMEVLGRAKEIFINNVRVNVKRNNKMKEYLKSYIRKKAYKSNKPLLHSTASTSANVCPFSFNISNDLGHSVVSNMPFELTDSGVDSNMSTGL